MMNPLAMQGYYSTLFNSFKSLLIPQHKFMLDEMIKEIEDWLSDDYNKMTLQEAEIRMYSNMDLLSGFEVNGKLITQLEINERLEKIKTWLTQRLYEYMPNIRFTKTIQ